MVRPFTRRYSRQPAPTIECKTIPPAVTRTGGAYTPALSRMDGAVIDAEDRTMARRNFPRTRSPSSQAVKDVSANRLPWQACIAVGLVLYVLLSWIAPPLLAQRLAELPHDNSFRPLAEALIGRRLHWLPRLGIEMGLICAFFAVRNFFASRRLTKQGEDQVGFFARLGARWLD